MIEIAGRQIATTLAEIVEPSRAALLIWDMEYAIGPNAFNYKEMLPKLQDLSALARRVGARVFYSVEGQTFIKNMGRVISRGDIPQEDLARTKVISEDVTIADRLNQVMDDYKKYMH